MFSLVCVPPAPCHKCIMRKAEPLLCWRSYEYQERERARENQTQTNQDEASCGGLLSIFVHYSCFKYQTLIIRKINKEFLKWARCTVLNWANALICCI